MTLLIISVLLAIGKMAYSLVSVVDTVVGNAPALQCPPPVG